MTNEPMTNDQTPAADQQWISTKEAAEIIGVTRDHVTHLLRTGQLTGEKFVRDWMVDRVSVEDYAAKERKPGPKPQDLT
jgi:excisionase family DNA binding protein